MFYKIFKSETPITGTDTHSWVDNVQTPLNHWLLFWLNNWLTNCKLFDKWELCQWIRLLELTFVVQKCFLESDRFLSKNLSFNTGISFNVITRFAGISVIFLKQESHYWKRYPNEKFEHLYNKQMYLFFGTKPKLFIKQTGFIANNNHGVSCLK